MILPASKFIFCTRNNAISFSKVVVLYLGCTIFFSIDKSWGDGRHSFLLSQSFSDKRLYSPTRTETLQENKKNENSSCK